MISRLMDDKSKQAIQASLSGRRVDTRGLLFRTLLQAAMLLILVLLAVAKLKKRKLNLTLFSKKYPKIRRSRSSKLFAVSLDWV